MKSRISVGIVSVVIALTTSMVGFAWTPRAMAVQGTAVIAGQDNTQTSETRLYNTNVFTAQTCSSAAGAGVGGLLACGSIGVTARGINYGVAGYADSSNGLAGVVGQGPTGVVGLTYSPSVGSGVTGQGGAVGVSGNGALTGVSGTGGNGVYGEGTENGVQAKGGTFGVFAEGDDYGVYARAPNHGVYGQATSSTGAGVEAAGTNGATALRVTGKAQFSRSGLATVAGTNAAPKSSVVISKVSLSGKSLVLATPQKSVAGVFVQGAIPSVSARTVIIQLNKAVTVGYPVAWFIVERP
ncbi:MAG: hypothetical protein ACJ77A_02995 [Actinomycetota bacterium]